MRGTGLAAVAFAPQTMFLFGRKAAIKSLAHPGFGEKCVSSLLGTLSHSLASAGGSFFCVILGQSAFALAHLKIDEIDEIDKIDKIDGLPTAAAPKCDCRETRPGPRQGVSQAL
jgi:hypothetical protein